MWVAHKKKTHYNTYNCTILEGFSLRINRKATLVDVFWILSWTELCGCYFTVQGYSRETKTVDVKAVEEKNNKAHALKLKRTIKWCESADSDTIWDLGKLSFWPHQNRVCGSEMASEIKLEHKLIHKSKVTTWKKEKWKSFLLCNFYFFFLPVVSPVRCGYTLSTSLHWTLV